MATGNYGRITDLRVRMAYAAMTSADPEAAQLALHGGEHVDALHRVMHDPGASGVNYDKIRSWLSKAARVADSRGVDPDAAVQWAMLRSRTVRQRFPMEWTARELVSTHHLR